MQQIFFDKEVQGTNIIHLLVSVNPRHCYRNVGKCTGQECDVLTFEIIDVHVIYFPIKA